LGVRTEPIDTSLGQAQLVATDPPVRWWESPLLLAAAGTIAVHLILGTAGDALVVLHPPRPSPPPPPRLELVDIEVPPVLKPPPPAPPRQPEPTTPPPVRPAPETAPQRVATQVPTHTAEPPPATEPPPTQTPAPATTEGGGPVVAMPDVAPSATGVAVARGTRPTGPIGRGGTGTGTGTGTGSGAGDVPAPMSVATIKTRALPHGDYAQEEIKDFPPEARQLGIEGKIRVKLIVDEHGTVKAATLLNKLGHGLDELALSRAHRIVFDPAKDTDDRPVASVVVWTFDMVAPK
jgi:protein TonB